MPLEYLVNGKCQGSKPSLNHNRNLQRSDLPGGRFASASVIQQSSAAMMRTPFTIQQDREVESRFLVKKNSFLNSRFTPVLEESFTDFVDVEEQENPCVLVGEQEFQSRVVEYIHILSWIFGSLLRGIGIIVLLCFVCILRCGSGAINRAIGLAKAIPSYFYAWLFVSIGMYLSFGQFLV